jgi:DNA-binding IscR family transcriptional regulator
VTGLASRLHLPGGLVRDFMETFRESRLVLPLADEEIFVLARDPEKISVKEILDCVRHSGVRKQAAQTPEEIGIDELLRTIDRSIAQTLEGKSLQSLIVEQSPPSA